MGDYLSTPNKQKHSTEGQNTQLSWGASSMQGWRKSNEDTHITAMDILPGVHLFAVFDGHGGKLVALYCEKHIPTMLLANEDFQKQNYEAALRTVFLKIDMVLISKAGKIELSKIARGASPYGGVVNSVQIAFHAGCTANVVLITPRAIICANSGDSRCVLQEQGQTIEMSYDHKPDLPTERQRVVAAGAHVADGRVNGVIAVSRAIGDWEYKKQSLPQEKMAVTVNPDIRTRALTPQTEFVIVACDGIWDCMTSKQACDFVTMAKKKKQDYAEHGGSPLIKAMQSPQKTNSKFGTSKMNKFGISNASNFSKSAKSQSPGPRINAGNPTRYTGPSPNRKSLTMSKQKSAENAALLLDRTIMASKYKGLATIVEMMMEKNCAQNLMTCEGLGADNMTCIIIEFNQPKPTPGQPIEMIGGGTVQPAATQQQQQQQQQQF